MLFNSPEFIFLFLPMAVALHFTLARFGIAAAATGTALASLVFYGWWNPAFLPLPLLSIGLNFALACQIMFGDKRRSRGLLVGGVLANLLVLGYFKYADFVLSILQGRAAGPPYVPLALSFTTFVQIAFLVDAYRRRPPIALPAYALFVSFFPHLIAGPIVRWSELGPQIADVSRYRLDWNNVALGLTVFTFGLGKKLLIADKLGVHVAPVFDAAAHSDPVTALAAWGAAFAYSAQLYFDFSGYSEMAIGLGLLFNLRLPINFAAPFRATSVIDLWRRWHVSLSRFLRDFVYVPLGGGQCSAVRRGFNLVATMTLGGLWHGAAWTFVIWGAFHGVLLAVNHWWRSWRKPGAPARAKLLLGWLSTIFSFAIGMVLFRAADLGAAGRLFGAMAGFGGPAVQNEVLLPFDQWGMRHGFISEKLVLDWFGTTWSVAGSLWTVLALAVAVLVPETIEICDYHEGEPHSHWRRSRWRLTWKPGPAWLAAVVILFVAVFATLGSVKEFLYYQF